ncbi:MAG: hypothetical protein LUE99_06930 [Bacteroides sp.]|nr:hypothetical protein [Bacteroides sp.]
MNSYPIFEVFASAYRTGSFVPASLAAIRSPWFVPSVGQWYDVMENLLRKSPDKPTVVSSSQWSEPNAAEMIARFNSHMDKVGTSSSIYSGYRWSSSEYDDTLAWLFYIGSTTLSLQTEGKWIWENGNAVCPFFAF